VRARSRRLTEGVSRRYHYVPMRARRVATWMLVLLLPAGTALGLASDQAQRIWNDHPRHAAGHLGAPHAASKGTLAAAAPAPPGPSLLPADTPVAEPPLVTSSPGLRPPFVPPRV